MTFQRGECDKIKIKTQTMYIRRTARIKEYNNLTCTLSKIYYATASLFYPNLAYLYLIYLLVLLQSLPVSGLQLKYLHIAFL
jgi:hypothetical protein